MRIVNTYPPFYDAVIEVFPEVAKEKYVIFTYGNLIYNPAGRTIPEYTLEHEGIHEEQHRLYPGGPDAWWTRYLKDAEFRYEQELEAYRYEYKIFCRMYKDRNEQNSFLRYIARNLASPLYGNCVTLDEAMQKIKA